MTVIHKSTHGGKVEKLSTNVNMWKCGKLTIVRNHIGLMWKTIFCVNSRTNQM